jgi:predicted small metal-binding protein
MKAMNCNQLGGACNLEFHANTFEEMAELSKQHGMKMHQEQDAAHLEAMQAMGKLMQSPEDMKNWFESKRQEFESLPES